MISASREEMERGGEDPDVSVRLANGGYLASTGVYHELHCLVRNLLAASKVIKSINRHRRSVCDGIYTERPTTRT